MMLIVAAFAIFIVLFFSDHIFTRPRLYPPGPKPLPLIGNLLSVAFKRKKLKYHHMIWRHWAQIYGNILGLRLGLVNIVIISGKDLIREVSSSEVFEGRPDGFFYTLRSFGKKLGIVFNDGPSWTKTRRVVLKYLKNFGFNSRYMEKYISEECNALLNLRMSDAGKPIQVNEMFNITIVNILWRLVAGKRFDLEDEKLKTLCDLITRIFKVADMSGGILNFLPFIRHIAPGLSGYNEMRSCNRALLNFIKETIEQHKRTLDIKNPRDVIDAILIEKMEDNSHFTDEELQVVSLDLLEAGMETVANTTVFILLHVVRNSEVQELLHKEIDQVIGQSRRPTLSDRASMVYTEAVLLESLRISSVAPVGIPHMALNNAQLGNYLIPKGTFILFSMYDLHNCKHWKDPHVFRPERFITKEGNLMQDEWLMPFGIGRRRCIGEGLARSELFMFLTHLLQKFNLKVPEGDPLPSAEPNDGLSLSAKPFRIVFEPRK